MPLQIGRDDGTLQVLGIGSEEPEVLFQQNMGESIRSVEVGQVRLVRYPNILALAQGQMMQIATPGFDEVAVATYSGRVIGFTTESLGEKDTQDSYGRSKVCVRVMLLRYPDVLRALHFLSQDTVEREAQIVSLQKDLEALEVKLKKEKEKFSKMDVEYLPMGDPLKVCDIALVLSTTLFVDKRFPARSSFDQVNASFHLDAEEAAYTLAIEIPLPIDIVRARVFCAPGFPSQGF